MYYLPFFFFFLLKKVEQFTFNDNDKLKQLYLKHDFKDVMGHMSKFSDHVLRANPMNPLMDTCYFIFFLGNQSLKVYKLTIEFTLLDIVVLIIFISHNLHSN